MVRVERLSAVRTSQVDIRNQNKVPDKIITVEDNNLVGCIDIQTSTVEWESKGVVVQRGVGTGVMLYII